MKNSANSSGAKAVRTTVYVPAHLIQVAKTVLRDVPGYTMTNGFGHWRDGQTVVQEPVMLVQLIYKPEEMEHVGTRIGHLMAELKNCGEREVLCATEEVRILII